MYRAVHTKRGWRVYFDEIDIFGAIDETVAKETAVHMNAFRSVGA
jgi:hypothetical protein